MHAGELPRVHPPLSTLSTTRKTDSPGLSAEDTFRGHPTIFQIFPVRPPAYRGPIPRRCIRKIRDAQYK